MAAEKMIEAPTFAFWIQEDHVLVSGNDRPKSALMLLRLAAALVTSVVERETTITKASQVEDRALAMFRRKDVLFLQGHAERNPDAVCAITRRGVNLRLAKLLTPDEHERIATVSVLMLVGLNRPGSVALYLDRREAAHALGLIVHAQEAGPAIPWTDPFENEHE